MNSKVKRYKGKAPNSILWSGMFLYILIFPLLMATFFALVRGDVKKFFFNLISYSIYFIGIKLAKKGFEQEREYKEKKLTFAPKIKYKFLASIVIGVGTFTASFFCVNNSLIASIVLSIATSVGFIFYYGFDPSVDKVNGELHKILEDTIKIIDEVKRKLSKLEEIKYSVEDENIRQNINIIIEEIKVLVQKVEDNPKLLSKVRKFFKVYLSRVVEISEEYSQLINTTQEVKDKYRWLLEDLQNTIIEQKKILETKDLIGLEVQIEALSKQLKEEGVYK